MLARPEAAVGNTWRVSERDADNIARLRRAYAAFSRGDFDAAMAEGVHPEIEYVPGTVQSPIGGADALRAWMEPDAFESQTVELLSIEPAGRRMLVHQRVTARGTSSGIELDVRTWAVWEMDDDGLAIRFEIFQETDEAAARRAAGLDPEAA